LKDIDIRDAFFEEIYNYLKRDKKIILLAVDQGALAINKIKKDFPKNYFNIGIFEQTAINFAAGLAQQGYKPYIYLIAPFTLRALEQIKISLCSMKSKVTIVASGPGFTYASDGPTHYFNEDYQILKNFPNLNFFCTSDYLSAIKSFRNSYKSKNPSYIRLEKGFAGKISGNLKLPINHIFKGKKIVIISNGQLTIVIKKVLEKNKKLNKLGLVDITQFIPLNFNKIEKIIKNYNIIILVDESPLRSSINQELYFQIKNKNKFLRKKIIFMNTNFKFWKIAGNRDYLRSKNNIDETSIKKKLLSLV
jgi:transketolase C-terminal domain/subunit